MFCIYVCTLHYVYVVLERVIIDDHLEDSKLTAN